MLMYFAACNELFFFYVIYFYSQETKWGWLESYPYPHFQDEEADKGS